MKFLIILSTLFILATHGQAASVEDESGSNAPMQTRGLNLDTVQEAFTDSPSMANNLTVNYKRGKLTKIYVREYMDTTIILPEEIDGYSLGDEFNFHWVPAQSRHRKNQGRIYFDNYNSDTNLTLFGVSGDVYVFYVRAIPHYSKHLPHLTVYVTRDDFQKQVSSKSKKKKKKTLKKQSIFNPVNDIGKQPKGEYLHSLSDVDVTNLNYKYEVVGGNKKLAPINIFDDGIWTYFKFADENFDRVKRLPVIYRVIDGFDNPINTRKFKGTVIAESTSDSWTLRHGASHICIRKVGYMPDTESDNE